MGKNIKIDKNTLDILNLKDRDIKVYTEMLKLGSASLRKIAEETGLNRGTAYDTIKKLMKIGLVSFVNSKSHRYFLAEDPEKLPALIEKKEQSIKIAKEKINTLIPELQALTNESQHRPAARYYDGKTGIKRILEDVLSTTKKEHDKTYRVYSSPGIRNFIFTVWPRFTETRIKNKISVKVISIGAGGKLAGLDERRWLTKEDASPSYIFIYGRKTAYVAMDKDHNFFGVIIEGASITETQKMIFNKLWVHLKEE